MKIIAYSYDAGIHCVPCSQKHFLGKGDATNGIHKYQKDSEGNIISPIFSTDKHENEFCEDCNIKI